MSKKYSTKGTQYYVYSVLFEDERGLYLEITGLINNGLKECIGNRFSIDRETFEKIYVEYTPPPVKVVKYSNVYKNSLGKYLGAQHLTVEEAEKAFKRSGLERVAIATVTWEEPSK